MSSIARLIRGAERGMKHWRARTDPQPRAISHLRYSTFSDSRRRIVALCIILAHHRLPTIDIGYSILSYISCTKPLYSRIHLTEADSQRRL